MLVIQFSYIFEKLLKKIRNSFCSYLNQIKQSGDEKKTKFPFLEKNGYHTISI